MKFGLFQTPFTRPERTPQEGFAWAVDQAVAAEQAGLEEFWVGQHYTIAWEPIPNPELVIAAAARETEKIVLAPGAHILPYHHPAALASQTAWMSHITGGRYILGIATGVNPVDAQFHGFRTRDENLAMTIEGLDLMEKVWSGEPYEHEGTHWRSILPEKNGVLPVRDMRPHGGKMQVALAGASPSSTSIKVAGERGMLPMSFGATPDLIANHWKTYQDAAVSAGRDLPTDRSGHHVTLDIFVADTDQEAMDIVTNGPIAHAWREHLIPNEMARAARVGVEPVWDTSMDFADIVRKSMVVGSVETVTERMQELIDASGGWGVTLLFGHDFSEDPKPWNHSMELLANEVTPRLAQG